MFEFLRPFEDFLIHNFELPGAILATALPFILIFLVIGGIVIAVRVGRNPKAVAKQLSKGVDELKAKQILQKAAALRRKGKYEEAYDLYVQLYKAQGKQKFVSAHEIGMLCKDGAEDDWSLEGREAQPNYWFFESILYTDDPASHYEYGLYLMENANGNHLRSADGANHIYEATQHGHAEAKIRWQKIAKEAARAMEAGRVEEAAGLGHAQAQYEMFLRTPQSHSDDAQYWLRYAAEQKNAGACLELGLMYFEKIEEKGNIDKAVAYFTVAAEQGEMDAQVCLGDIYSEEENGMRNIDLAIKWYTMAAEQGHTLSMIHLEFLYREKMRDYAQQLATISSEDPLLNPEYMEYLSSAMYWRRQVDPSYEMDVAQFIAE